MQKKIIRISPEYVDDKNSTRLLDQSVESFFKVFNASPGGMCITDGSTLVEVNHMF